MGVIMLQSLILTSNPRFQMLETRVTKHYGGHVSQKYSLDDCLAVVRGHTSESLQHAIAKNEKSVLLFSGRITNLPTLRYALLGIDSGIATYSVAKILLDLYTKMGVASFSLLEGEFSIIIKTGDTIKAFTDSFGMLPLYYVVDKTGFFWFTNEVKSILEVDSIDFSIKAPADLYPNTDNPHSFSYFKTIKKIPPGCQFEINTLHCTNDQFLCAPYHSNHYATNDSLSKELTIEVLDKLLQQSIQDNLSHDVAGLSLSGGLDSSLISAITNKYARKIHTFSLGTDASNEFEPAKLVSDFLGTTHHEMMFTQENLLTSLLHTIFYNEVLDSVCIEVHMPFWVLLKRISTYTPCVFTGFGADMLFSGHASPDADLSLVHQKIKSNIARVQWRGEYTPFVAQKLGVDVHHPFCGNKLIAIATSLDPKLKIFDGQVKYVLRELASQKKYLPEEICRRKKIALEEASAINKLFSDYLGLNSPFAYEQKDKYTYLIFKDLFENKKAIQNMDVNQYIKMIETESFA